MSATPADPSPAGLATALAGASATFSGLGLARFAYVPLFPAMVAAGWVSGGEAGLLGALNLAGYLIGVLLARPIAHRIGTAPALDLGMALIVATLAGCGWNGGTAWLAACRCLAGIAGGILMITAGPAVQAAVAPSRRGLAGGIVMTGVGGGALAGALVAPQLLWAVGVAGTWIGMAVLVLFLWLLARLAWPRSPVTVTRDALPRGSRPLVLAYGLSGAGLVPHMVYLADFAIRGRDLPRGFGMAAFLAFSLGGFAGPLIGGRLADRIGSMAALRIWLGIQCLAIGLIFVPWTAALLVSGFLSGFASVGMSAVALTRTRELAGPAAGAVWARATAAFALAQAATGLLMAHLFAETGSHLALFAIALGLSVSAFVPLLARATPPG